MSVHAIAYSGPGMLESLRTPARAVPAAVRAAALAAGLLGTLALAGVTAVLASSGRALALLRGFEGELPFEVALQFCSGSTWDAWTSAVLTGAEYALVALAVCGTALGLWIARELWRHVAFAEVWRGRLGRQRGPAALPRARAG